MNKKQKTFMKVASIGCIIEAAILLLVVAGMLILAGYVNESTVGMALRYSGFKETLGVYTLVIPTGSSVTIASGDVTTMAYELQQFLFNSAITLAFWSAVNIVIGIVVLIFEKKGIDKKWPIIIGLIACIPLSNWVCLAFYIVVLCLRQKKVTLETVDVDSVNTNK